MKPLVSICCITYNHEKYIAKALDSFLMQETSFPIEIIIHDDASTDKTSEIIAKYEKMHPDIVKPIYQKENQFSKGKKPFFECALPYVSGNYIALCEGDDYWCDKNKIQRQVDFLVNHKEYSSCFHAVEVVDISGNPLGRYLGPKGEGSKDTSMRDNIQGGFIHLSSLMIRADVLVDSIPDWVLKSRHGDYALALIVSANGKVHYIDKVMSAYRFGVANSMMTKLRENYSKKHEIEYHKQRIDTLSQANEFYSYKFDEDIQFVIQASETKILLLNNEYRMLFSKRYRSYFREKGLINTIKFVLLTKTPKLARRLASLKGQIFLSRKPTIND